MRCADLRFPRSYGNQYGTVIRSSTTLTLDRSNVAVRLDPYGLAPETRSIQPLLVTDP
jgi:hypothetical protein